MTLHQALSLGLLIEEPIAWTVDGQDLTGTRLLTCDKAAVVWHDPSQPLSWRWARIEWSDDGSAGQGHGGAGTLWGVLWAVAALGYGRR